MLEQSTASSAKQPPTGVHQRSVARAWKLRRSASASLAFYALMGLILKLTHGHFHGLLLILLTGGFLAYAWVDQSAELRSVDLRMMTRRVATVALLFALFLWHDPELVYRIDNSASRLLAPVSGAILVTTVILWLATFKSIRMPPWFESTAWVTAVGGAFALRLITLIASPRPAIDVWVVGNLGSDVLLAGGNPYAATYPDIYHGAYDHAPHFFYWPGYLLSVAPFRWFVGDVRGATIVTDAIIVGVLFSLAQRLSLPRKTGRLICLAWLLQPVSLFVLEQAWIDPVMMAGLAVMFLCLINGWWAATGVALAYIVGVKQYGVLVAGVVFAALVTRNRRGLDKVNLRSLIVAGLVATAALFGPFLLIDARAFYESTVQPYLRVGLRADALSIPAWIHNLWGLRVPDWTLGSVVLLVAGFSTFRLVQSGGGLARVAFTITLVLGTFFLLGKLAFCNYYYLVSFCTLLHLVTQLSPGGDEHLVLPRGKSRPVG